MLRTITRLTPVMVVSALLTLALPVAAQVDPGPPGRPDPNLPPDQDRAFCLPVGLALTVFSQDGTVADILPVNPVSSDAAGTAPREITLPGPGAVGACVDYQGYWGSGVGGTATARLTLHEYASDSAGASITRPVAYDKLEETRRGPATHSAKLKALTKLEKPGKYHFLAVIEVAAQPAATAAVAPTTVKDSLKVRFTVVIREEPVERPPGAIEGRVVTITEDGTVKPIAGAIVAAKPARDAPSPPLGPGSGLPIVIGPVLNSAGEIVILGGEPAGDEDPSLRYGRAVTDEAGHYRMKVPAGKYIVNALARGYDSQFYRGKEDPDKADLVEVKPNETTSGIHFHLVATTAPEPPEPPEPPAVGFITGNVSTITANGAIMPLAGAIVAAMPADPNIAPPNPRPFGDEPAPGRGSRGPATRTDQDGNYELKVPVGKWIVHAFAEGFEPQWFNGVKEPENATVIKVAADAEVLGVDFALKPQPVATITGMVLRKAGDARIPVEDAIVVAVVRTAFTRPGDRLVTIRTTTDEEGTYTLLVPPGTYAVGVKVGPTNAAGDVKMIWWDNKEELEKADPITLVDGQLREDINFLLPGTDTP